MTHNASKQYALNVNQAKPILHSEHRWNSNQIQIHVALDTLQSTDTSQTVPNSLVSISSCTITDTTTRTPNQNAATLIRVCGYCYRDGASFKCTYDNVCYCDQFCFENDRAIHRHICGCIDRTFPSNNTSISSVLTIQRSLLAFQYIFHCKDLFAYEVRRHQCAYMASLMKNRGCSEGHEGLARGCPEGREGIDRKCPKGMFYITCTMKSLLLYYAVLVWFNDGSTMSRDQHEIIDTFTNFVTYENLPSCYPNEPDVLRSIRNGIDRIHDRLTNPIIIGFEIYDEAFQYLVNSIAKHKAEYNINWIMSGIGGRCSYLFAIDGNQTPESVLEYMLNR